MAVLAITSLTVYRNWDDARRAAELTQSNRDYLRTLNNLMTQIGDAESGQRGYMLTGRDHYLLPYNRALAPLKKTLQTLAEIAQTRPDQKQNIDRLTTMVQNKMAELAETIQLRRTQGLNAAMVEILTDKGLLQMEQIRELYHSVSNSQRSSVAAEAGITVQHQLMAIRLSAAGGLMILGLMGAGFVAVNSSARQQTQLAESLAESREAFETTLTSIGDGVLATNTKGIITFMNPEAGRLTGWPRSEALGKSLSQVFRLINESSRAEVESPFIKVMKTGSAVGLANHTILIGKDEAEIAIDDSGAPIRNAYGQVSGVVLVFRGIAERRKAEAALQLSHNEVLKANEELRQFSYAATHDLQEPLRTIVVFSQLLGRSYKDALDERGQHLLRTVEEAALRMSALIQSLLAYTRVGGTDSSMSRAAVDAAEILDDTLVQLKGSIEETRATITFGELPKVWSEPAQLSQVFQNLISNAIKYRRPDVPPVIHVTSTITGDFATFQITDNGIGFKQEYSDRIFLLFQRLHGRTIPGTGIGLALCRRIIERQGGRIWVNSEEDKGSSFYFTLPVATTVSNEMALS